MKSVSISELKQLKASEIKSMLPFELTSDAIVIAEIIIRGKLSTKCPNCGKIFDAQKPTDAPYFFSIKHQEESWVICKAITQGQQEN